MCIIALTTLKVTQLTNLRNLLSHKITQDLGMAQGSGQEKRATIGTLAFWSI
ncbi:hypothetical protein K474DRAFT_1659204 [Panus rudis PR-1116 ss-1]|nr:hypothetical protein K474DRAFT_1659204 [Panus rudis PR-1116 ss-1]